MSDNFVVEIPVNSRRQNKSNSSSHTTSSDLPSTTVVMAEEEEPTQFDQSQKLPGAPTPIASLEVSIDDGVEGYLYRNDADASAGKWHKCKGYQDGD